MLHHAAAPGAKLAELRVLPASPVGRFDAGMNGFAGLGPTICAPAAHRSLPLATAVSPLLTLVLAKLASEVEPTEAAAALPGLCTWVAAQPPDEILRALGAQAGTCCLQIAHGKVPMSRRASTHRTARWARRVPRAATAGH